VFSKGDLIDGKYRVTGLCSDAGGMGALLHVKALQNPPSYELVLKYCRETSDEYIKRFCREVRLLSTYKGNSRVVQVEDSNLVYDPPYFVMKYYSEGDLLSKAAEFRASPVALEEACLSMVDAIQELHSRDNFHRDIKPQNFLLEKGAVVASDFGLTTELGSGTAFTRSSSWWGTHGYIPPEFLAPGGFKNADAAGDIFMLGKTIYKIASDRDPLYLMPDNIPAPLYHVIERACSLQKNQRYESLAEMRQSIAAAFDAILERGGSVGKAKQQLAAIADRLSREQKYVPSDVSSFVESLCLLDYEFKIRLCEEIPPAFFHVIAQKPVSSSVEDFLRCYEALVESQGYSWAYAETIADRMKIIFIADDPQPSVKALSLDLAVRAARYMNRFAAMDTCRSMVTSVRDEFLGAAIAAVLHKHRDSFISDIEPSECSSSAVASALSGIRSANKV